MPHDINNEFIDIDFEDDFDHQRGFIDEDPLVARSSFRVEDFESYQSGRFMLPESEWKDTAGRMEDKIRSLVYTIMNQGREGSCVGYSTTQAVQVRMSFQFGEKYRRLLSGMSLYNRIGRSAQSGAMMSDGARESAEDGILPLDTSENRELYKHVYRPHGFVGERRMDREVPGWEETAGLFKPTWLRINSVDAWMSALLQCMPMMYGRSGHAICSLLPKHQRGQWWFGYLNSWGKWGDRTNDEFGYGIGWDSISRIRRCVGYACVNVSTRPEMALAA